MIEDIYLKKKLTSSWFSLLQQTICYEFEKIENDQAYIGVMEIDGSNERMISKGYKLENPAWTLDGRRILYNQYISFKN